MVEELRLLEEKAVEFLSRCVGMGQVAPVTNAEKGWVELSAAKFLPGLVPILDRIKVVSARTMFEPQFPNRAQM